MGAGTKKRLRFAGVSRIIFSMTVCHACREPVAIEKKLSRTSVCPNCRSDLHACKNCRFFDRAVHNQCRETQAEWVADKEKANFCDYFVFADRTPLTHADRPGAAMAGKGPEAARKRLDELFKKAQ
jgi:hypothetical protein